MPTISYKKLDRNINSVAVLVEHICRIFHFNSTPDFFPSFRIDSEGYSPRKMSQTMKYFKQYSGTSFEHFGKSFYKEFYIFVHECYALVLDAERGRKEGSQCLRWVSNRETVRKLNDEIFHFLAKLTELKVFLPCYRTF